MEMNAERTALLPKAQIFQSRSGSYLLFDGPDAISRKIREYGSWAHEQVVITLAFCRDVDRPLVLDIGANLGAYAVPVAREIASRSGAVYAFEPQRVVFYQLCANAIINSLDNIFAFNEAVGAARSVVEIPNIDYARSINTGGFSIDDRIRRRSGAVSETVGHHLVAMKRLDDIDLPRRPSVVKIDVEGFEAEILLASLSFLQSNGFPMIIVECWDDGHPHSIRNQIIDFLTTTGYDHFIFGDEMYAQHSSNARLSFRHEPDDKFRVRPI